LVIHSFKKKKNFGNPHLVAWETINIAHWRVQTSLTSL
jgi:hypothetical protein